MALVMLTPFHAQTGGRKKEGKTKKHGSLVLRQYKSRGHADEFARGSSGRRGIFARLFKKDRPAWQYKSSGSRKSTYRANRFLFAWHRTNGKRENAATLDKQNSDRAKYRVRGSRSFKFKRGYKNR
jgi:hypothetical protein